MTVSDDYIIMSNNYVEQYFLINTLKINIVVYILIKYIFYVQWEARKVLV